MSEKELEKLLELHNNYTFDRFSLRMYQTQNLDELEEKIGKKQAKVLQDHQEV
jgi:NAD-dependent SIR2 family protein deacetylase